MSRGRLAALACFAACIAEELIDEDDYKQQKKELMADFRAAQ